MSGYAGLIQMGAQVVGGLQSAYGYQQAGAAAATSANTNAAIMSRNAQSAIAQAQQDETVQQRRAFIELGQAKSLYGASGVTGDSGSALDVLASSAANASLEARTIAYKGSMKALGYADQAQLDSREAVVAMQQGNEKARVALFQALGSGAADAYDSSSKSNPSTTDTSGLTSNELSTLSSTSPGDI